MRTFYTSTVAKSHPMSTHFSKSWAQQKRNASEMELDAVISTHQCKCASIFLKYQHELYLTIDVEGHK